MPGNRSIRFHDDDSCTVRENDEIPLTLAAGCPGRYANLYFPRSVTANALAGE